MTQIEARRVFGIKIDGDFFLFRTHTTGSGTRFIHRQAGTGTYLSFPSTTSSVSTDTQSTPPSVSQRDVQDSVQSTCRVQTLFRSSLLSGYASGRDREEEVRRRRT